MRPRMTMEVPDFGGQQLCNKVDPELFFPDESLEDQRAHELMPICGACPVRDKCLEWALSHSEAGIWAATTPAQRRRARRKAGTRVQTQQQRAAATRRTVRDLAGKGLSARQIVDQTGIHEQTVWRAMRALRQDAHEPRQQVA